MGEAGTKGKTIQDVHWAKPLIFALHVNELKFTKVRSVP